MDLGSLGCGIPTISRGAIDLARNNCQNSLVAMKTPTILMAMEGATVKAELDQMPTNG